MQAVSTEALLVTTYTVEAFSKLPRRALLPGFAGDLCRSTQLRRSVAFSAYDVAVSSAPDPSSTSDQGPFPSVWPQNVIITRPSYDGPWHLQPRARAVSADGHSRPQSSLLGSRPPMERRTVSVETVRGGARQARNGWKQAPANRSAVPLPTRLPADRRDGEGELPADLGLNRELSRQDSPDELAAAPTRRDTTALARRSAASSDRMPGVGFDIFVRVRDAEENGPSVVFCLLPCKADPWRSRLRIGLPRFPCPVFRPNTTRHRTPPRGCRQKSGATGRTWRATPLVVEPGSPSPNSILSPSVTPVVVLTTSRRQRRH